MSQSLSARLAEYLSQLRFDELPASVVDVARSCILDDLGIAVGGYEMETTGVAVRTAKLLGSSGAATIWVDGHKGRAIDCVLANSVMGFSTLQDAWHPWGHCHINVTVVPAVLGLAEEGGLSGREALVATVAGYEAMARVALLSSAMMARGFRPSAMASHFGGATVAAKLLKLNPDQFKNALSCAGSAAGGIGEAMKEGSMERAFQEGLGCRAGILAALLAREGLKGADRILEGEAGVNQCFAGTHEGEEAALRGLGERFEITETCFKRFPSGGANQGSFAVAMDLAERHSIDYRRIRAVRVRIPHPGTHERMDSPDLRHQGPFHSVDLCLTSKPFGIAAILKNHRLDMDVLLREQRNAEIVDLAHRINLEPAEGATAWSLAMEIEMEDGTVLRGDESNIDKSHLHPSWEQVAEKFVGNAAPRLGDARTREIVERVSGLEGLDSVTPVVERMVFG